MIRIAETLATGFPFVRVDLYAGENGPLFGEMTFAPGAGLSKFFPAEYDFRLGALWPTEPASDAPRTAGAWKPKAAF